MDVGQVQGMGEFSLPRIPGMRHQVDLAEPWRSHIPTIGLHRDMMLQQSAGLGAPVNTPFPLALLRLQSPVDLPCTDAQQLFLYLRSHPLALATPGHPAGQQGLQPHRPGIARGFPDRRQDGEHLLAIARPASARPPLRLFSRRRSIQQTNRIFPVVSGVQAKFVQHHLLGFASSFTVTLVDSSEIFPLRLVPQSTLLKIVFESGYILCVSTAPPPVTFSMARYAAPETHIPSRYTGAFPQDAIRSPEVLTRKDESYGLLGSRVCPQ